MKTIMNLLLDLIDDSHPKEPKEPIPAGSLQLSPITLNEEYCKEWNENENLRDFVHLTRDGELVNKSLYRVGGIGSKPNGKDYFMLLKYVEAKYDYDFIKRVYPEKNNKELELQRKHLEGRWCILDKDGVEKVESGMFKNPYPVKGSCLYSVDQNYYNIETGEFYCKASKWMESNDFIFLENPYDKDLSRRGVLKIDKKTGTYEIFSGK